MGLYDRSAAKEINFAICLGMGAAALTGKINRLKEEQGREDFIDVTTAQSYIDPFYERFPEVKECFRRERTTMKKLPRSKRRVTSLIGRKR